MIKEVEWWHPAMPAAGGSLHAGSLAEVKHAPVDVARIGLELDVVGEACQHDGHAHIGRGHIVIKCGERRGHRQGVRLKVCRGELDSQHRGC